MRGLGAGLAITGLSRQQAQLPVRSRRPLARALLKGCEPEASGVVQRRTATSRGCRLAFAGTALNPGPRRADPDKGVHKCAPRCGAVVGVFFRGLPSGERFESIDMES